MKAALEEDRGNLEAHFALGHIYKSGGANALAAAAFQARSGPEAPPPRGALRLSTAWATPTRAPKVASKTSGLRKLFGGS